MLPPPSDSSHVRSDVSRDRPKLGLGQGHFVKLGPCLAWRQVAAGGRVRSEEYAVDPQLANPTAINFRSSGVPLRSTVVTSNQRCLARGSRRAMRSTNADTALSVVVSYPPAPARCAICTGTSGADGRIESMKICASHRP